MDTEGRDSLRFVILYLIYAPFFGFFLGHCRRSLAATLVSFFYTPVSRCSLDSGCTTSIILHEVCVVFVVCGCLFIFHIPLL